MRLRHSLALLAVGLGLFGVSCADDTVAWRDRQGEAVRAIAAKLGVEVGDDVGSTGKDCRRRFFGCSSLRTGGTLDPDTAYGCESFNVIFDRVLAPVVEVTKRSECSAMFTNVGFAVQLYPDTVHGQGLHISVSGDGSTTGAG